MAASFERLAAGIPADLPGPVLVIGMAETAVGLGAGVHRAYRAGRPDSVYLTSTRHPLGTRVFARFEEEHSHASAHLIHWPVDPEIRDLMLKARSLILVDDEASTGKTFLNLHRALVAAGLSNVERVVTCVLTDWTAGAARHAIGEPVTAVSLLTGSYQFHEDQSAPLPDMPNVGTVSMGEWPLSPRNDWGRLGVREVDDTLAPDVQVRPGESHCRRYRRVRLASFSAGGTPGAIWRGCPLQLDHAVPIAWATRSSTRCRSPTTTASVFRTSSTT